MISIWEKQSFFTYDVIIAGGGISGLSTALSLKEKEPKLNILVLERGMLPTGASTKNAGFACFGSVSELMEDVKIMGVDKMKALVEKRWKGLQLTRKRLGDCNIGLEEKGGYELIFTDQKPMEDIHFLNGQLKEIFEQVVFSDASKEISKMGFGKTHFLIKNHLEAQIDTGKMMKSLWQLAIEKGIFIQTGAKVTDFTSNTVTVNDQYHYQCKAFAICTNAFTKELTDIDLYPGRGIVMYIKPEKPLNFEGTFHYEEGFYYFRDYQGHLLFGGGRNMDIETEKTTDFAINPTIKEKLLDDIKEIILPNQSYNIEMEWTGIMAFGPDKNPVIQKTSNDIYIGTRLGGMGVALGSQVGEELSSLICSHAL